MNTAILSALRSVWKSQVVGDISPTGRLWVRWLEFGDDAGWDDWSLFDLHADPDPAIVAGIGPQPVGEYETVGIWLQWCRTHQPDGPSTERIADCFHA